MTNNAIQNRILTACNLYYKAFDTMPEKIGVGYHTAPHLQPYIIAPVLPRVTSFNPASPEEAVASLITIKIEVYNPPIGCAGLNFGDFVLYSEKTGTLKPEDLEPSAALVKRIIEAQDGYKVMISEALIPVYPNADVFYIFKYREEKYISWAISRIHYEQGMHILRAEIDTMLRKFEQ